LRIAAAEACEIAYGCLSGHESRHRVDVEAARLLLAGEERHHRQHQDKPEGFPDEERTLRYPSVFRFRQSPCHGLTVLLWHDNNRYIQKRRFSPGGDFLQRKQNVEYIFRLL
jgi:hypothetical protein